MPHMTGTRIMTLGALPPMFHTNWLQNRRVTPQQPQNLLRAVTLNGVHSTARFLSGLGAVGDQALAQIGADAGSPAPVLPAGDPIAMNLPSMPRWPWQKDVPVAAQIGTIIAGASLSLVSGAVSAYHGYKRDRSGMAAFGWGVAGMLVPVIVPIFAFGQGYARPKGRR